jgi:hypothetical protein
VEAYTVPGWPRAILGHTAVTPNLTRLAGSGAMQYKDGLTGQPGTRQIPVTGPQLPGGPVAQALMGTARSSDAPAFFLPNLYFARPQRDFWPGAGMPVSVDSDNLMPVPATDPRGIPARLASPPSRRGRRDLRSVPPVISWPPASG